MMMKYMLIKTFNTSADVTKLTQTVDELSARDCRRGYFLLVHPVVCFRVFTL